MWLVRCGVCQEEWLNREIGEIFLGVIRVIRV